MKLSDIIVTDAVIPELQSDTRDGAIEELIQSLADAGAITKRSVNGGTGNDWGVYRVFPNSETGLLPIQA